MQTLLSASQSARTILVIYSVGCQMLRPFAPPVACCCVLFGDVAQSLKPVKRLFLCKRT